MEKTEQEEVLYPLYHMGLAAEGNVLSMLIFTAIMLASFGAVYAVLSRSFLKLATSNRGTAKIKYVEKKSRISSPNRALLRKEFRRFFGSTGHMLNCGLGIVFMLVAAVALVIKRDAVIEVAFGMFEGHEELLSLAAAAILTVCIEWLLKPSLLFSILIPVVAVLFVLFIACLGLTVNLKLPNLTWTSETVPIKQSAGVMVALFGGWVVVLALGIVYYLLMKWLTPAAYLLCAAALLLAADIAMLSWLRTRGARIFETL